MAGRTLYTLGYPNREAREGLNGSLLRQLMRGGTRQMANCLRLYRLLEAEDLEGLRELFHAFCASNPYE